MSNYTEEQMLDLLSKQAMEGLNEEETRQLNAILEEIDAEFGDDGSFELAAAAISMVDLNTNEPLPEHLQSKILADAEKIVGTRAHQVEREVEREPVRERVYATPKLGFWNMNWLGWAGWTAAAAACIALIVNLWVTDKQIRDLQAQIPPSAPIREELTMAQLREQLMASPDIVKASWAPGNMKDVSTISGDIVWSDSKQAGYMRFRGLPINDKNKETYQLWIFDETQDTKTPIDGGTFDVQENGDVVVPIHAKLKAARPAMFAITVEKPGGVVVSKREKIPVLAKVESL